MTDADGSVISVHADSGPPFFYISTLRALHVRQAFELLGFRTDPAGAGKVVLRDEADDRDPGEEVVAFEPGSDPDTIQDILDELSWSGDRVVREVSAVGPVE